MVHRSFDSFINKARHDANPNLSSKQRTEHANEPQTCSRDATKFHFSSIFLEHVSSAAKAFNRLRELTTSPDHIHQCLQTDHLKLLQGRHRAPNVSKSGSEGYLQDDYTLEKSYSWDWFSETSRGAQNSIEEDFKSRISF